MPRTALTPIDPTLAGVNLAYTNVDQANGNQVAFGRKPMLNVKNTGAGACTVTVRANGVKFGGVTIPDVTVSVPATTGNVLIGDLDPAVFMQSDGTIYIDYSTGSGVQIAALETG